MKRNKRKEIVRRGEIRLEVYTMRSNLYPQWWEFRKRFRFWRLRQRVRTNRKKLSPLTQALLARTEKELEKEFLYGPNKEDKE